MRITSTISTITTVVSRVIKTVAVAGKVRSFLNLTAMRERLGFWLEPCPLQFALAANAPRYQGADMQPGKPGQCHMWHTDIAHAVSAPVRFESASATRSGTRQRG